MEKSKLEEYCQSDLIVIPTGNADIDKKRTERAMKFYESYQQKPKVAIVGNIQRNPKGGLMDDSQSYGIYKNLRRNYKLKPKDMRVEGNSNNTIENFLYLLPKINESSVENLFIATNPTHYWRFKLFANQAKKEKLIKKDLNLKPLYTREGFLAYAKGIYAYIYDYLALKFTGSLEKAKEFKKRKYNIFLK